MPATNHQFLRSRRDELDLSNGELAARIGRSTKYLSNIISGVDEPSMRVIHRIAVALDVDVSDVLAKPKGDPSEPPKQPGRPSGPGKRQTKEPTRGPRRATEDAA
ncbi:helix-turn-helix domain-containing protein [Amycolatopsis sp. NPDC088138]|uniref:helix-turn-helix domain-containing protein n=1 Tax=Amycolatopsis sp. NPDC088138 TaxID=3363938 RepID=UPI0037FC0E7B